MKNSINIISTGHLKEIRQNEGVRIVDVRPVEAYNGWKLSNEPRGGHIKGAGSLPSKWANYIDWIEIVRNKRFHPHHHIIIYGNEDNEMVQVAERFRGAGYQNISLYRDFLTEWLPDENLPVEKMPRYRHLVYPRWVDELISGENPPEYENGNNYVICHAHYRNYDDYLLGHIPGAVALDTLALESPETWNRRSPEELKASLEKHGINSQTTVILYGRFSFPDNNDPFPGSSAGQLAAIRCAVIMMYAGVKDVRILNGGLASWEAENLPLETKVSKARQAGDFGADIPVQPELFVDLEQARQMLASESAGLVCTRSWPEYIGEVSGYNYIAKKGRIPGAIYVNNGSDAYHMESYQNLDYTTRQTSEIEDMLKEHGAVPEKHLAFYCGTGWRGSEAFINAWLAGWPRVSVYDGGWFEWSNDPDNPVETGIPEEKAQKEKSRV